VFVVINFFLRGLVFKTWKGTIGVGLFVFGVLFVFAGFFFFGLWEWWWCNCPVRRRLLTMMLWWLYSYSSSC
ncbi:hypothetical protein ACNIRN_25575, partial [Escherichia coli]